MGGADAALRIAQEAYDSGDYRWAAEVLDRILFADEHDAAARDLQAATFEQLGYGCENGTWRSVYLAAAHELRHGVFGTPVSSAGMASALTVPQVFASVAVHVDGPAVLGAARHGFVGLHRHRAHVRHRVAQRHADPPCGRQPGRGHHHCHAHPAVLIGLVTRTVDLSTALAAGSIRLAGDPADLAALFGALSADDPSFPDRHAPRVAPPGTRRGEGTPGIV